MAIQERGQAAVVAKEMKTTIMSWNWLVKEV